MKPIARILVLLPLLLLVGARVWAANEDWAPVSDDEKNMKSNPLDPGSGAVVLFKRGEISVIERSAGVWTTRIRTYERIKILTDAGRQYANVALDAPKWIRFSSVDGRTILPSGQIIPLDSSQVFRGRAFQSGKFALLKTTFTLPSVQAGAIIEYQTEENVDSFFVAPWVFDTEGLGTISSTLRVVVGPRLFLAQFPISTTLAHVSVNQTTNVRGQELDYTVADLKPVRSEPYAAPFRDQAASVLFSPYQLAFGNGTFPILTGWDDVGKLVTDWSTELNKSNGLARNAARDAAGKQSDERQRAMAVYQYLQRNMTSSSLVGVGFGGRTADELIKSKQADPDEINAMLVTMLKEVKIDAQPVLVADRSWETLQTNFPNISQFSRMIVQVKLKQGPVLVDASEPGAPFGVLPWVERGITGLLVKGSKVEQIQIPIGVPDDNRLEAKLNFQLGDDWKFQGGEEVDLTGANAVDLRQDLLQEMPEKLDQRLTDYLSFGTADASVSGITHPDLQDSSQAFVLKGKVEGRLVDESGPGELLLNPWIADRYASPVFKSDERHGAVRLDYPEKRVSTSTWTLPLRIRVTSMPKDANLDNEVGSFSHSCKQDGVTLTCTRSLTLKKMEVADMTGYRNMKSFFDQVAKDDQEVVVLRGE